MKPTATAISPLTVYTPWNRQTAGTFPHSGQELAQHLMYPHTDDTQPLGRNDPLHYTSAGNYPYRKWQSEKASNKHVIS